MKNGVMEIKKICTYLLDELEFSIEKISRTRRWEVVDGWVGGLLTNRREEDDTEKVEKHLDHIRYSLKKLRLEISDLHKEDYNTMEPVFILLKDYQFDTIFTDLVIQKNWDELLIELEKVRAIVLQVEEKIQILTWKNVAIRRRI